MNIGDKRETFIAEPIWIPQAAPNVEPDGDVDPPETHIEKPEPETIEVPVKTNA